MPGAWSAAPRRRPSGAVPGSPHGSPRTSKGGSLENAIILGETGVLNALRFEDEFVRHKILDAIGDLSLVGYPVVGHLVAHRGGHALHTAFAAKILAERDAWQLVESPSGADMVLPVVAAAKVGAAARA